MAGKLKGFLKVVFDAKKIETHWFNEFIYHPSVTSSAILRSKLR